MYDSDILFSLHMEKARPGGSEEVVEESELHVMDIPFRIEYYFSSEVICCPSFVA